jgi:hypothetical protein
MVKIAKSETVIFTFIVANLCYERQRYTEEDLACLLCAGGDLCDLGNNIPRHPHRDH